MEIVAAATASIIIMALLPITFAKACLHAISDVIDLKSGKQQALTEQEQAICCVQGLTYPCCLQAPGQDLTAMLWTWSQARASCRQSV